MGGGESEKRVFTKGLVFHENYLLHETGGHPERKERLMAIMDYLHEEAVLTQLALVEAREATLQEVALNHDPDYIEEIRRFCGRGGGHLDPDTVVCRDSYKAALWAVGGALAAVDAVLEGGLSSVFCAVRPPGHHALRNRAMGFCIFNNVAVAARYAREKGVERVLIVDWDAHHGNGTQVAFYDDPSVFYFSTHQWPLYPGTGRAEERGVGAGLGYTLNCPLPPGSGDEEFSRVYDQEFLPVALEYRPELILISAGYDAHELDPLTSLELTTQGYGRLAHRVARLAREVRAPVVALLEGGYSLSALARSVAATIEALP